MFIALPEDLSKAFDCLDHELHTHGKTNAYGFGLTALKLVHNYYQTEKNGQAKFIVLWKLYCVPQGSTLRPLLFNIFLIDLFFIIEDTDIDSYADDNTPYVSADNIDGVMKSYWGY